MKAIFFWSGALLCVGAVVGTAQAGPPPGSIPHAPDTSGPGFYCANPCGGVYGPNYYLQPGFPPFSGNPPPPGCFGGGGMMPPFGGAGGAFGPGGPAGPGGPGVSGLAIFPSHTFARGPRDYFMED